LRSSPGATSHSPRRHAGRGIGKGNPVHKAEERTTGLKSAWPTPNRWPVLAALSIFPLAAGALASYTALNAWQTLMALAVGAGAGGVMLAISWTVMQRGTPLLDVLGRGGALPMTVLWVLWAIAMGTMTLLWAGEVVTSVLPLDPALAVIGVGLVAGVVAWLWHRGKPTAAAGVVALTASALVLALPQIAGSVHAGIWHLPDRLNGQATRAGYNPFPISAEWPQFWTRLVDLAGVAAATVLLWVPVGGHMSAPDVPPRGSGAPALQAAVVALAVLMLLFLGGAVHFGPFLRTTLSSNPAVPILSHAASGWPRDVVVVALTGGGLLWLATIWAAGPPTRMIPARARTWATVATAAVTVAGATLFGPNSIRQLTLRASSRQAIGWSTAHWVAGHRLLGGAYLIAPLAVIAALAWLAGNWPALRRHGVAPLSGTVTAIVWLIAVAASTPWIQGFGWFGAGPLIHHVILGLLAHYHLPTAWRTPDWALVVGMVAAVVVYGSALLMFRQPPPPVRGAPQNRDVGHSS
jgi:hypothetical protein